MEAKDLRGQIYVLWEPDTLQQVFSLCRPALTLQSPSFMVPPVEQSPRLSDEFPTALHRI